MSVATIMVRALRSEVQLAQTGLDMLKTQRTAWVARRDALQSELDVVKAGIAKLAPEIIDAQQLITDLQAEITAVQARRP